MRKLMIITLGGRCGSGKSTVSKILADELGYEIVSIGAIKREIAKEMGLTILEFDKLGWSDPDKSHEFDYKYEEYQQSLDLKSDIILDSKLSFFCQPDAYNVFITVDDKEGAKRIFEEQRSSDAKDSFQEVLETNKKRHVGQQSTYKNLYDVDIFDMNHYNLIVDSTNQSPKEVAETILKGFNSYKEQYESK